LNQPFSQPARDRWRLVPYTGELQGDQSSANSEATRLDTNNFSDNSLLDAQEAIEDYGDDQDYDDSWWRNEAFNEWKEAQDMGAETARQQSDWMREQVREI
jgi:hypothetical protein